MHPILQSNKPTVQPLPRARRRFVFVSMFIFFLFAVPAFVFYATGYRYNYEDGNSIITTTGGLYITVGGEEGEVFLNEQPVRDSRVFRSALYIQNLVPGMQRVHVQAEGLQTWVKELPVYPYIVTEAESFALPVVPQVRPISKFKTATGSSIFTGQASGTKLFADASSSVAFVMSTSTATTTLTRNSEYDFVYGLFSTTTATSTLLNRVVGEVTSALTGGPDNEPVATTTPTTTKMLDDLVLYEEDGDIFVAYNGPKNSTPYYFCVPNAPLASTSALYGKHVMLSIASVVAAEAGMNEVNVSTERICRTAIRIDRKNQEVVDFEFFPSSTDLVVLHLKSGVLVVEIDDRSWQNTQLLYPNSIDELVINNGKLYAKDGDIIFELLTTLPAV